MQTAAHIFPKAAKANHNVFYDAATGRAKSLDEVYAFFDRKFQIEGDKNAPAQVAEIATPARKPKQQQQVADIAHNSLVRLNDGGAERRYMSLFTAMSNKNDAAPIPSSIASANAFLANPLDVLMLAQSMDIPTSPRHSDKASLFATRTVLR
jgi:hypothetical protein